MLKSVFLSLSVMLLGSCHSTPIKTKKTITYNVVVDILWSGDTYPEDFPKKGAYIGPLIGIAHDDTVNIFVNTNPATEGLAAFATKGSVRGIGKELNEYIKEDEASQYIADNFYKKSPGRHTFKLKFYPDRDFDRISIMCNLAPSPDWFLVARNVQIRRNKKFLNEITFNLNPFDAGVDLGTTYLSEPNRQNTPNSISPIVDGPLATGTYPIATVTMEIAQ